MYEAIWTVLGIYEELNTSRYYYCFLNILSSPQLTLK